MSIAAWAVTPGHGRGESGGTPLHEQQNALAARQSQLSCRPALGAIPPVRTPLTVVCRNTLAETLTGERCAHGAPRFPAGVAARLFAPSRLRRRPIRGVKAVRQRRLVGDESGDSSVARTVRLPRGQGCLPCTGQATLRKLVHLPVPPSLETEHVPRYAQSRWATTKVSRARR